MSSGDVMRRPDGRAVARYRPDDPMASLQTYSESGACGINVFSADSLSQADLQFFERFPCLKIVLIQSVLTANLSLASGAFAEVEEFVFNSVTNPLNLAAFPTLRKLAIQWGGRDLLRGVEDSPLETLQVWGYKCRTKDLKELPIFPRLRALKIAQSNIISLSGIDKFPHITDLELHYLSGSVDLSGLASLDISRLTIENCRKIKEFDVLACCKNLRILQIHECGAIASVGFVKNLRSLASMRFVGTSVSDGDLSALLDLEDVMFDERPHYSHTLKQFRQDSSLLK